jgi:hypothetical protein
MIIETRKDATMSIKFAKGVEKVRAGKNVWVQFDDINNDIVVAWVRSTEQPAGENWTPLYPARRVSDHQYQYYAGGSEWEQAANAAMASEANRNFRRGQSY